MLQYILFYFIFFQRLLSKAKPLKWKLCTVVNVSQIYCEKGLCPH